MNFERGLNPKEAMKIGKYADPKKVRCLKNKYKQEYHKLQFVKKQIYDIDTRMAIGAWVVYDCYGQPMIFADKTFKEYFEIYA
jgi:hypothetical protein